ncbi:hypothetical protein C8R45DRAFT_1210424 [Mycena sanguinolenta]|nr:hypothetical protein C8R45DRAFT_1210424 [Mycena sanguinolenta]
MPYSPPVVVAPPHTAKPHPGHRRSYTFEIDHPKVDGSLRILPRRIHTRKFHFGDNDSSADETQHDPDDAAADNPPPALCLIPAPTSPTLEPFPVPPPALAPTVSTSHCKPLRSALKSSCSAPHVPSHHSRLSPRNTPLPASPSSCSLKAVHFPAPDAGLEDVRLFKRSARPASVSLPLSLEENETETETESDAPRIAEWGEKRGRCHFRRVFSAPSPLNPQHRHQPQHHQHHRRETRGPKAWRYVLDAPGVPKRADAASMVLVERLWVEDSVPAELTLHGTVLARNAAFEKHVLVRFTLDGWTTTNEVGARYVGRGCGHGRSRDGDAGIEEEPGPGWDRFSFGIRLAEQARSMRSTLRLVLAARFYAPWVPEGAVGPYVWCDTLHSSHPQAHVTPSGRAWVGTGGGGPGEWWDNNGGSDYHVGLRRVPVMDGEVEGVSVSLPATTQGTNFIPFPSMTPAPACAPPAGSSTPSSSTATPPSAPSSISPSTHQQPAPQPEPIPPPPPRTAHALALAGKLRKLRVRNWTLDDAAHGVPEPGHSTASAGAADPEQDDSSASGSDDDEGETRQRRISESDEVETPPTSPVDAGGLLPIIEKEEGNSTLKNKEKIDPRDVPLPRSPSPSPLPSSSPSSTISPSPASMTTSSPNGAPSSSYPAFVRQRCFAEAGVGGGGPHVQALLAAWWG